MSLMLISVLLVLTPVSAPARNPDAAQQIALIADAVGKCKDALGEYPSTTELQDCDFEAWNAARNLVAKSNGNAALETMWPDLFGELVYYLAGGDALAMRVVVASKGTDFELNRAAVLTRGRWREPKRKYSDDEVLRLLRAVRADDNSPTAKTLFADWKAVRDADCAAYPVTDCSARLNAAFGGMLAVIKKSKD